MEKGGGKMHVFIQIYQRKDVEKDRGVEGGRNREQERDRERGRERPLIDKHVHQNNTNTYASFIDIQKAFDSIWHTGLIYKVIESGVGGKT